MLHAINEPASAALVDMVSKFVRGLESVAGLHKHAPAMLAKFEPFRQLWRDDFGIFHLPTPRANVSPDLPGWSSLRLAIVRDVLDPGPDLRALRQTWESCGVMVYWCAGEAEAFKFLGWYLDGSVGEFQILGAGQGVE